MSELAPGLLSFRSRYKQCSKTKDSAVSKLDSCTIPIARTRWLWNLVWQNSDWKRLKLPKKVLSFWAHYLSLDFSSQNFIRKQSAAEFFKNSTRNFAYKNRIHLMIPQIFIMCGLGDILISGIVRWHRGWHHSRTIVDEIAIFCFWIPVFSRKVFYYGVLSTCRVQLYLLSMSIRRT